MSWIAALDILIAAFVIYQALVFIQGRRAMHMVVGVALAVLFFYFSRWTRLDTVSWLLSTMLPYFVFLIIIVFQSEIRRALAHFGETAFPGGLSRINRTESEEEIILSVEKLASSRTGALIVIERNYRIEKLYRKRCRPGCGTFLRSARHHFQSQPSVA